jgi:S-formylglutathione hydrolase FrmB
MALLSQTVTTAAGTLILLGPLGNARGQGRRERPREVPGRRREGQQGLQAHLGLGCGTDDRAIDGGRALSKVLTGKGIRHEWVESPGYRHDYQIWRIYLRDLLPRLFWD